MTALLSLPQRVAIVYLRCLGLALRLQDEWSLRGATRPHELARLIQLARGRTKVVEVGTGTTWTAMAFAVADPGRQVVTYDPNVLPRRGRYLSLIDPATRARIELVHERGEVGPDQSTHGK